MRNGQDWVEMAGQWYAPEPNTGCWLWLRTTAPAGRYGWIRENGKGKLAHRVSYESHRGPIAAGMTIDHLCRTPLCVNPSHMRVVSQRDNVLANHSRSLSAVNHRKTHCPQGHSYADHGRVRRDGPQKGHRACMECDREYHRRKRVDT